MNNAQVFHLYIDKLDNPAFAEGNMQHEIARILHTAADEIAGDGATHNLDPLHDINGNIVGRYALRTEAEWNGR